MRAASRRGVRRWWMAAGAAGVVALAVPAALVWADGADGSAKDTGAARSCAAAKKLTGMELEEGDHTVVSPDGNAIAADGAKPGLWMDGKYSSIESPTKDFNAVQGVNSDGLVVGQGKLLHAEKDVGWKYEDGKAVKLKGIGDYGVVFPEAVSDDGTIVGAARDASTEKDIAVKWAPGELEPTQLKPGSGEPEDVVAHGISDDGTIVGSGDKTSWIWDAKGKATEIPTPSSSYDGGVIAIDGDWVLTSTENEFYRLDISKDNPKLQKVDKLNAELDPADIDSKGRVYQQYKSEAVVVDLDNKVTTLDRLSGDDSSKTYAANSANADGTHIVGTAETAPTDPSQEVKRTPITWTCK